VLLEGAMFAFLLKLKLMLIAAARLRPLLPRCSPAEARSIHLLHLPLHFLDPHLVPRSRSRSVLDSARPGIPDWSRPPSPVRTQTTE
jgi:hypothetical protein